MNTFSGQQSLKDADGNERNVDLVGPEPLEFNLRWMSGKTQIDEWRKRERFKRRLAGGFVLTSIFVFAILIVLDQGNDGFKAAQVWWTAVGVIVGYLVRMLFESNTSPPQIRDG